MFGPSPSLSGRRVLITGAARGIGAALAQRLHAHGARVALAGLEADLLAEVAASCDAPWWACDVADRSQVRAPPSTPRRPRPRRARRRGRQRRHRRPAPARRAATRTILERTFDGERARHLLHAARRGPHISHPGGYAVAVSSLGGAVHVPLMGAYSASKAAVEALGNTLRQELRPTGARVGVAYFAELDTDMTSRGFGTEAAQAVPRRADHHAGDAARVGIDALERGIARRSRVHRRPGVGARRCSRSAWSCSPSSTWSSRRRLAEVAAHRPTRSRSSSPPRSRSGRVVTRRRPDRAGTRARRRPVRLGRSAGCRAGSAAPRPPNLFLTLGRHRPLFRGWLRFAGRLMPGGKLPRRETELVILRVAHLRGCAYEFDHHVHLGAAPASTPRTSPACQAGPDAAGWSPASGRCSPPSRRCTTTRDLDDATWDDARAPTSTSGR